MKKLSRLLAFLLIVVMLAGLSVSCKKKDDEEEDAITATASKDDSGTEGTEDKKDKDDKEDTKTDDKKEQTDNGANTEKKEENKNTQDNKDDKNDTTTQKEEKPVTGSTQVEGTQHGEDEGSYKVNDKGEVVETGDHDVDEEFVIQEAVTNDNGFIPDDEQGLEKSERRATAESKYDFDRNPLINRDRQVNRNPMPSFDIDETGFVAAGTRLKDLKGKTLQFFTADNFAAWSYRNAKGETISEWEWFKQLKNELGLNIKYTVKQHMNSTNAALQSMNAGKQCDIVYTNHVVYPSSLCLSRSITELISINNIGSSPGVCKNTMDICRWGNSLRVIAPIGVVDVLWYNQTLTQELGLSDPHIMWEKGAWSWETFKKYMLSAPKTTKEGKELVALVEWTCNTHYVWANTNGKSAIRIVPDAKVPTLENNWMDPQVLAAWEFITNIHSTVNYKLSSERVAGTVPEHIGLYEGTTLMSATMYTQVYRDTEYSKHIQINWVPFPKANTDTGKDICQYYGFGMVLPKKTSKPANVNIALKFMELWATRFTETLFDNLNTFEYYNFNYMQRKQYFDFVTKNVCFGLAMNDFSGSSLSSQTNFWDCFRGNAAYNVRTEATKAANIVNQYVIDSMKYGM